jgi:hypothetical protein
MNGTGLMMPLESFDDYESRHSYVSDHKLCPDAKFMQSMDDLLKTQKRLQIIHKLICDFKLSTKRLIRSTDNVGMF